MVSLTQGNMYTLISLSEYPAASAFLIVWIELESKAPYDFQALTEKNVLFSTVRRHWNALTEVRVLRSAPRVLRTVTAKAEKINSLIIGVVDK
jgi:hypothetical protein